MYSTINNTNCLIGKISLFKEQHLIYEKHWYNVIGGISNYIKIMILSRTFTSWNIWNNKDKCNRKWNCWQNKQTFMFDFTVVQFDTRPVKIHNLNPRLDLAHNRTSYSKYFNLTFGHIQQAHNWFKMERRIWCVLL